MKIKTILVLGGVDEIGWYPLGPEKSRQHLLCQLIPADLVPQLNLQTGQF